MEARDLPPREESVWLRLVFMVLFAIIFNVAEFVLAVIAVVQFLCKAISGKVLTQGLVFGQNLATYVYEIMLFLTFRTDEMPWPFAPWPDGAPADAKRRAPDAASTAAPSTD